MTKRPCVQKFKEAWKNHPTLMEWLDCGNDDKAFCKYCKINITCRFSELFAHATSNKHLVAYNSLTSGNANKLPSNHDHLTNCSEIQSFSFHSKSSYVEDISLAKCHTVIALSYKQLNTRAIAKKTNLIVPKIEKILKYKEHILRIYQYAPYTRRFITPNELNNIIALNEILKEFMWRLLCKNIKITDEELMLNGKLLKRLFCVFGMQVNNKWTRFFRKNFKLHCKKPFNWSQNIKTSKHIFYVRNIFKHVEKRLDSEVVARFNEHLKKNSDLILICTEMFEKQYVGRKLTSEEIFKIKTNNVDENFLKILRNNGESQEDTMDVMEKIEFEEYVINANANDTLNKPQSLCMTNDDDDSNEMIEIYAEIDEDDDDNDDKTEKFLKTVEKSQKPMDQEYCLKQNTENSEYKATEAELSLVKIKEEPNEEPQALQTSMPNSCEEPMKSEVKQEQIETNCNSDKNDTFEIYAVNNENHDDENLIICNEQTEKTLSTVDETQNIMNAECCMQVNKNSEYTTTVAAELPKYSLELTFDQIKKEPIEINAINDIKEEEKVFEEQHAMQSSIQNVCIKLEEPEIKQEPTVINANSDNYEHYKDQEVFQNPQATKCLLQRKYILTMEHEIKQEPSTTSNEHEHLETASLETLNTEIDDSVQCKQHKIGEEPNDVATNFKYSDHLTEQRALQIGKIFDLTPYGKLCCETLLLDPIICTYMDMLSNQLPIFSQSSLFMSFNVVLCRELYKCPCLYSIQQEDFELYRQFLVLVYSSKYKPNQLKDLMKDIFSELEIKNILDNSNHILEEWRTFFKEHFISMLYRKAVYEMFFEYKTRYSLISGVLNKNTTITLPQTTVKNIQQFLRSDFELEQHWQKHYNAYIIKKVNKTPQDICRVYTVNDLNLNCIYEDIKELLPQLVVEYLNYAREEDNDDSESSKAIDCLNVNISTELSDDKATIKNDKQNLQQETKITTQKPQNSQIYSKRKNIQDMISITSENISETSNKEPPNKKQRINQVIPKVVYENNSKVVQIVDNSEVAEISTANEQQNEQNINKNASDVKVAETVEIANIEKIQTWHMSNLICVLQNDPIITTYLKLIKYFPFYNKRILKKAFEEVFKENNNGHYSDCQPQDLNLYSKLLLLYYTNHDKYKNRVAEIMNCFDDTTIKMHYTNISCIILEWRIFFNKNLSRLLYKQAIYEMLYEYTQRYLRNEKDVSDEVLIHTAAEIQRFLRCHIVLPQLWLTHFNVIFEKRLGHRKFLRMKNDFFNIIHTNPSGLTVNNLEFHNIYDFVKYRLNYLLIDTLLNELNSEHSEVAELSSIASKINNNEIKVDENSLADGKFEENIDVIIKEQLVKDPIIMNYFQLSNAKSGYTQFPVFDEHLLRSAFNEVLYNCEQGPLSSDDYQLYRQLILFKYSEQCYNVTELAQIMLCFTESSIRKHFQNYGAIIRKWYIFNENFLSEYIYQQALYELLYEYAKRFMIINGHISNFHLQEKSEDIKSFFLKSFDLPSNWLHEFNAILIKKLSEDSQTKILCDNDLELETIYENIKSRLHFLVIERCDSILSARKNLKTITREPKEGAIENITTIKTYARKIPKALSTESGAQIITAQVSGVKTKAQNENTQEKTHAKESNNNAISDIESFKIFKVNKLRSIDCIKEEIIELDSD